MTVSVEAPQSTTTRYTPHVSRAEHYPQLDGLRAVAVLLVLLSHTLLVEHWMHFLGDDGVRLFFVLSAFLITGILLRERDRADSLPNAFGRFYLRRALRIFPAYYTVLAVLWLVNVPSARSELAWHALYGTNWLIAFHAGASPLGTRYFLSHFWSLAVEEQFYLAWPLLVFTVPRRRLGAVFVGCIAGTVVLRAASCLVTGNSGRIVMPLWANLDALALGAFLAWRQGPPLTRRTLVAGLLLSAMTAGLTYLDHGLLPVVAFGPLGAALVAVWVVDRAARGRWPVLSGRPLQSLGRISYGVYLWHLPVLWALRGWWTSGLALFVVDLALTLAVASVSWVLLERPVLALKRYVPSHA